MLSSFARQSTTTSLNCAAKSRTSSNGTGSSGRRISTEDLSKLASNRPHLFSLSVIKTAIRTSPAEKITDYLKDIGVLTLQEEKSNTCHLGTDKKGRILPRVLRIDVQTLRDNAEKYDLFEQQAYE